MSTKPIFVASHPRACSTAFERVFMTRRETLKCIHEPFGDAFYYGPERLSFRFEEDEQARQESGFGDSTFQAVFDRLDREASEGKRLFIKDIIHYLIPPKGRPVSIAPSLQRKKRGVGTETNGVHDTNGIQGSHGVNGVNGTHLVNYRQERAPYPYATASEPNNPTVVPSEMLRQFHFAFLIRNPHSSVPSYFRCTIPPLDEVTGFHDFYPSEMGYDEVRRVFEYLRDIGAVGPHTANSKGNLSENTNGAGQENDGVEICVVDADDLLDNPSEIIEAFCNSVGLKYDPEMLHWDNETDQKGAMEAFEKWKGFHEDALGSKELKPRTHKKAKSEAEWDADWKEKYGEKAAKVIRTTVDRNMDDYLFMKQFAIKV